MCLARLVRAVLGDDAVANGKLETGNPLVILGIGIRDQPSGSDLPAGPGEGG